MGKKSLQKKRRLAKAAKKNRRIPAFIVARTKRRVSHNQFRRNWRRDKLRITED